MHACRYAYVKRNTFFSLSFLLLLKMTVIFVSNYSVANLHFYIFVYLLEHTLNNLLCQM